jgi:hypothetical protein
MQHVESEAVWAGFVFSNPMLPAAFCGITHFLKETQFLEGIGHE